MVRIVEPKEPTKEEWLKTKEETLGRLKELTKFTEEAYKKAAKSKLRFGREESY
jgi:hypothetical protein